MQGVTKLTAGLGPGLGLGALLCYRSAFRPSLLPRDPMACKPLLLALLCLSRAGLAAADYGYLRVSANTSIYHGADANSDVEASATKGQVYTLRAADPIHGFYKIEYSDHVSFIQAGDAVVLDASGTPVPTPAPENSVDPAKDDSEGRPSKDKGTDEEGGDQAQPSPTPTPKKALIPKEGVIGGKPGDGVDKTKSKDDSSDKTKSKDDGSDKTKSKDDGSDGEVSSPEPTPLPTRAATKLPTLAPTAWPTRLPTLAPTVMPTHRPTPVLTPAPTEVIDEEASPEPTALPTRIPTVAPTLWPTRVPTPWPTPVPTHAWPTPSTGSGQAPSTGSGQAPSTGSGQAPSTGSGQAPYGPTRARGRRSQDQAPPRQEYNEYRTRTHSSRVETGSTINFNSTFGDLGRVERPAGKLNDFELHLPLGWSKHETLVQPPFKQTPSTLDQRPIEFGAFAGLGLEFRSAPWLRWDLDWTAFSHRTKAADLSTPATKVNVPGLPSTTVFDESEAYYRMNTHAFRLGVKASLPIGGVVEPWLSASYGAWLWSAELSDLNRAITYGQDEGVAWGGSLGVGVDFHGTFGGGLGWSITPFAEWGAPQVNPQFSDIAGLGVDWKDSFGTPVAIPARLGIQFGIGY